MGKAFGSTVEGFFLHKPLEPLEESLPEETGRHFRSRVNPFLAAKSAAWILSLKPSVVRMFDM